MAASKPILGVLESGSEVRCLIEDTHGGLCCEPGEYDKVEENLRWFIDNCCEMKMVVIVIWCRAEKSKSARIASSGAIVSF